MTNKFDDLELDDEVKQAFLQMPREEQLFSILSMQAYLRRELASMKRKQIDAEMDAKRYRQHRESKEREMSDNFDINETDEEKMSITQKMMVVAAKEVAKAFASRFDVWVYFRDRVLPTLLTGFLLGLLYLVYGKP